MKFAKAERAKEVLGLDRDEVDTGGTGLGERCNFKSTLSLTTP